MPRGTLEVVLISAKGIENNDFLCSWKFQHENVDQKVLIFRQGYTKILSLQDANIDPYVILSYRSQEHKSTVQKDGGSNPQWNESFLFTVSDSASELNLRIMDKDSFSADDFLGEAIIPIEPVFAEGSLPETAYNVVKDQEYCGEIRVALTFTPERGSDQGNNAEEESYGGWNQSARDF